MRSLTLSVCLLALALAACGGDDPGKGLPSSTARGLTQELAAVQRRLDQGSVGACEDVLNDSVPTFQRRLDSLPEATDPQLRSALDDSFAKLRTLSEQECDERRKKAEDKQQTEPDTTPEPVPTTPAPAPPPTTPEPTTPKTTPKPDKGDENQDKNNGKGKSNGDNGGGSGGSEPSPTPGNGGQGTGGSEPQTIIPDADG